MRKFTFLAGFLIVCIYVFLGSIYILNKDYTDEKAELSTIADNDNPRTVRVYVPNYMVHLNIPRKEWSGQNEIILQKDYELHHSSIAIITIIILLAIGFILGILVSLFEPD